MSCLTDRKIHCRHYHEGYETVENSKTSGRELPFSKLHFQWVFNFIKKSIARVFPKSNSFGENVVPKLRGLC